MKSVFDIPLTMPKELAKCVALSLCPRETYNDGVFGRFLNECSSDISRHYSELRCTTSEGELRTGMGRFIDKKQEEFAKFLTTFREELFRLKPEVANRVFPIYIDPEILTPLTVREFLED